MTPPKSGSEYYKANVEFFDKIRLPRRGRKDGE